MDLATLVSSTLLGNSLRDWALALLAFAFTFMVLPLLRGFVSREARKHRGRELPTAIALLLHLLEHTSQLVLLTVALFFAERILTLPDPLDGLFDRLIIISLWLQVGLWGMAAVRFALQRRTAAGHDPRLAGSLEIVIFVARLIVWAIVILLALDNLGVNVTTLVAGLGVGGIAIALAVQTVLGDLFASLSIALDKPFTIGDMLRIDDIEGNVEKIGIKSTRLRSVSGEQVILSNAELLKSRVRNLGRMQQRRALFSIRVAYDTPYEKLQQVPALVEAAVKQYARARFTHCRLKNLGESALEYEVLFFVPHEGSDELAEATDVVNLAIVRQFGNAGIGFAHPMRTVEMRQPLRS